MAELLSLSQGKERSSNKPLNLQPRTSNAVIVTLCYLNHSVSISNPPPLDIVLHPAASKTQTGQWM